MSDCLLLNTDAQPVSFLPLSTINWKEAIQYMVLEKASVLEWHDDWIVHSEKWATPVPAVIMLREYVKPQQIVRFSNENVFLRDEWTCQYCGTDLTSKTATMDHVVPMSHGGKTIYTNIVTACFPCNSRKGNNAKIVPKKKPHRPEYWELVSKHLKRNHQIPHSQWKPYLDHYFNK